MILLLNNYLITISTDNGCPFCYYSTNQNKAASEFNNKANLVHNNKYDYSLVEYKTAHSKVKIICPIHGTFEQIPNNHLSNKGCPHCASETSGFTRTNFKDSCTKNNESKGILYVLECFNNTETFIKIGITSRSIKKRYPSKSSMPYEYTVLHEISGSPEFIYDLETLLHKKSKNYKYTPNVPFGGHVTECFKADLTYLSKLHTYLDFKKETGVS